MVEKTQDKVKNFNFHEKVIVHYFIAVEMKTRELIHDPFAERVDILLNCPKGRKVT